MWSIFITGLSLLLQLCYRCEANSESSPLVTIQNGQLRGTTVTASDGQQVNTFLGIPYAAPPIGTLRFAPPSPHDNWRSELNATSHGDRCLERVIPEDPKTPKVAASEDCLHLDVYAPTAADNASVMLYFHGGGFYGGTGALYDFTNVAAKGVVVIAINYRLDIFGFLAYGDDVIPGNYGLLDQAFALQWVKSNIRAFGGNPDDVTLFGGSSGASSVSFLSLSPLTRGTFQKAIMASGVALSPWALVSSSSTSRSIAQSFGMNLACDTSTSESLLTCLRGVPADVIINTSVGFQAAAGSSVWLPVVDGHFLPEHPRKLLMSPQVASIPTLRGYSREDMSYVIRDVNNTGLTSQEFITYCSAMLSLAYTHNVDKLVLKVAAEYFDKPLAEVDAKELRAGAIRVATDALMVTPAVVEAKLFSGCKGQDSYLYELAHRPSYSYYAPWQGVVHADEKGYVLGLPQGPDPFSYEDADDADREVSDLVTTLWTNMAKYGHPTPSPVNGTVWAPYSPGPHCDSDTDFTGKLYLIKQTPELVDFDRADKVLFWEKTLPELASWMSQGDNVNSSAVAIGPPLVSHLCFVGFLTTFVRDLLHNSC